MNLQSTETQTQSNLMDVSFMFIKLKATRWKQSKNTHTLCV